MARKPRNRIKEQANKRHRHAMAMIPDAERRVPARSTKRCEECGVTLSRYNTGIYCHPHQRMRVWDGSVQVNIAEYMK